jgi:hypothetical protein
VQNQVTYRLKCCLNGVLVQNRATGLRQELIERKPVEIKYEFPKL